ncbi:hypothetical protein [Streptomyces sp. Ag109_O5-10]|nr:hypothetical protein [Streptomyces sp. Ag109_O5-10]SED90018.1 hypothetical protein SAMN05216533_0874 [Streptomyces sp. Ag109_O5-10]
MVGMALARTTEHATPLRRTGSGVGAVRDRGRGGGRLAARPLHATAGF